MSEEQMVKVVAGISDLLTGNDATIGDAMWILLRVLIEIIDKNADESARNIMKMESAKMLLKSAGYYDRMKIVPVDIKDIVKNVDGDDYNEEE